MLSIGQGHSSSMLSIGQGPSMFSIYFVSFMLCLLLGAFILVFRLVGYVLMPCIKHLAVIYIYIYLVYNIST